MPWLLLCPVPYPVGPVAIPYSQNGLTIEMHLQPEMDSFEHGRGYHLRANTTFLAMWAYTESGSWLSDGNSHHFGPVNRVLARAQNLGIGKQWWSSFWNPPLARYGMYTNRAMPEKLLVYDHQDTPREHTTQKTIEVVEGLRDVGHWHMAFPHQEN
jgi:hypothetical protein